MRERSLHRAVPRPTRAAEIWAKELFTSGIDYLEIYDAAHSELEERVIAIGPIHRGLVLIVYTERSEDTVRIISARWATTKERALYLEHMEKQL